MVTGGSVVGARLHVGWAIGMVVDAVTTVGVATLLMSMRIPVTVGAWAKTGAAVATTSAITRILTLSSLSMRWGRLTE
jgi:hypothetical protein